MPTQDSTDEFSGKVAIVTGGADGIGRATAVALAKRGARVWAGDVRPRSENNVEFTALGITQVACDVRREADVIRLIESAVGSAGRLDILVSNAGVGLVKQIPDVAEEDWDRCLDTNLKGAFLCAKHAIPHLRRAGGGSIVTVASNAGLLPRAHDPVYCISKAALIGLTRSLALCHAVDKIRVNAVCPGPVGDTGMMREVIESATDPEAQAQAVIAASPIAFALGRMIKPEEVAQAIVYLASEAAVFVSGTALAIDGAKAMGVPPK